MIVKKRNFITILLLVAILSVALTSFASCILSDILPIYPPDETVELTFLKTEGELVKNESGEEVYLRGINVGGLFVTEHWMTGFKYTTPSNDYKSLSQTFIDRFGADKTKALWAEYRSNWWTDVDFENCAKMGMNVLRLPFTYMNVDFDAITSYENAGKNYDFSALDEFVTKAAKYGMYTILDLHGAYGSHNGQDHSGEIIGSASDVKFFSDREMMDLTLKLWDALSERYKNNPYVAGYDILNEPGEKAGTTSRRHWDFYDEVYNVIRKNGDEHIVIFESCWDGKDLPQPSEYGWENCMYSFHHYTNNNVNNEANILAHGISWNEKVESITSQNFGVPIYMGEFTSYTSEGKWDYTLDLLNRLNWHWTSWTYKVWGNMPWGIVNIRATSDDKVDAMTDEYDVILNKFKILRTNGEDAKKYTFPGSLVTLESVMKRYCTAPSHSDWLVEDDYLLECGGFVSYGGIVGNSVVVNIDEDYYLGLALRLRYNPSRDGSVYLTYNGRYLTANTIGGVTYLTLESSIASDYKSRFFPVAYDDGWAFVSLGACRYIAVRDGLLTASVSTVSDATVFYLH